MKLNDVLARYASSPHFGEKFAGQEPDHIEELRSDLKAVGDQNRVYFLICVGMIVLLFVGACVVTVRHIEDLTFLKEAFAVTGVSITWLALQMSRLWQEKVRSDTLLVLARNLPAKDIRGILEILLKNKK
jgi:hypothetical protein